MFRLYACVCMWVRELVRLSHHVFTARILDMMGTLNQNCKTLVERKTYK